jgi:hypothetical protein
MLLAAIVNDEVIGYAVFFGIFVLPVAIFLVRVLTGEGGGPHSGTRPGNSESSGY